MKKIFPGRTRKISLALLVLYTCLLGGLANPAYSSPASLSNLPPVPGGLRSDFMLGLFNGPNLINNMKGGGAAWDARYQYLTGGVNTSSNWTTWNSPAGQFATNYINDSYDATKNNNYIPVFTYYQIYQSLPATGDGESEKDYNNLNNTSTMNAYYADFKLLMDRIRLSGKTVVVHIEPDLWGFLQKRSTNPNNITASVASSGYAGLAGYPNTVAGFARALVALRDKYAPTALLAYHISPWSSMAGDVGSNTSASFDVNGAAQETANFYNQTGANYDLLFYDIADRDSAYYESLRQYRWWDTTNATYPNFNRFVQFVTGITAATNKRGIVWQIPIGNTLYRSENNTNHHWQDNRVQYYLGQDNNQKLQELADAGIIGLLFGPGDTNQTSYDDSANDGVTNPPAVGNNTAVSNVADDDGGYLRLRGAAYYSRGAVTLANPPTNPVFSSTPVAASTVSLSGSAGSQASSTINITNTGGTGTSLIVSGPSLTGSGAGNFTVSPTSGLNIAAGSAAQVVTVSCTVPNGNGYTAALNYSTNDPSRPAISYNLTCGSPGTIAGKFNSSPYAPGATIELSSPQNQAAQTTLTIGNTGSQGSTLNIQAAQISQATPNIFSVSPSTAFGVAGGATQNVVVSCTPAGAGVRYTATLTYSTNDPNLATVTYNLACNGVNTRTVTNPNDDGLGTTGGTLSEALANYTPNQFIVFALQGNKTTINTTATLNANRGPVTIDGGTCTNGVPGLTIDGTDINGNLLDADGLTLGNGVNLKNVMLKGFARRTLVTLKSGGGGGNKIGLCVVLRH